MVEQTPGAPSLRTRFVVLFCFALALCASTILLFLTYQHQRVVHEVLLSQARGLAATISGLTHDEVAGNDRVALSVRLETFNRIETIRSLIITDRRGQALAAVQRNAAGNLSAASSQEIGMLESPGSHDTAPPSLWSAEPTRVVWFSIGEIAPIGWVRLEYEVAQTIQTRQTLLMGGAILTGLIILTGGVLAAFSVGLPLRSLRRATAFAHAIAQNGTKSFPYKIVNSTETRELQTLGRALINLQQVIERAQSSCASNDQQLRQLLAGSGDPVAETDAELRILQANLPWQNLQARLTDDPSSLTRVLAEGETERLTPILTALVTGAQHSAHETLRLRDGFGKQGECWIELSAYRMLHPDGEFSSILWHGRARDACGQALKP